MIPDVTIQQLLQRVAAYLIVVALYGPTVTWLVRRAGDPGPAHDGRLTPNPLVHLDIVAMLAAIFFRVGWMKPLDVDATAFRSPRAGAVIVMAGSTIAMVAFALVCLQLRPLAFTALGGDTGVLVANVLALTFEIAVTTVALNLLPLPPLVGALWWSVVRPGSERIALDQRLRLLGTALIAGALVIGPASPPLRATASLVRRLAGF